MEFLERKPKAELACDPPAGGETSVEVVKSNMCGIFGYIGNKNNVADMVLDGLKLLEYRGYDSWGIAVKHGNEIAIEKHVGKIGDAKVHLPDSSMGIGHTRWATHGGVTEKNAHPHMDCTKQIAVLHNGIIENYAGIKEELLKNGHKFISETDTEIVPHLIEEKLKTENFETAVQNTFNRLRGLNAFVVAYAPSNKIIAAKTGSPLVIGKGDDGWYVASDVSGIIKHTRSILFLKDFEMVVLDRGIRLLDMVSGEEQKPIFESIDWKIEDVDKGTYAHFMIKEIHEQPTVIRNIAKNYSDQITALSDIVAEAKGTFFIGAGTAFHACLAGSYLFSKIAKQHVNTTAASEFNYLEHFLTDKSLVIALSQSGETIDVIEPLNRAKEKESTLVAIVNVLGSTIYRMADHKLLLSAGPEKAVASTKAYIAKLSILLSLSYAMTKNNKKAQELLLLASDAIEESLMDENVQHIEKLAHTLKSCEHMYIIGRGVSYPTSLEAALKIKEVSYIHTEGLAGGELKHGTIALIEKGTPCIVFAPKDETYEAMLSNAMELKARGAMIIGISSENTAVFDHWIYAKDVEDATMLTQIVPIQLLSYYLAVIRGNDPDKPRNLAKSVTVK